MNQKPKTKKYNLILLTFAVCLFTYLSCEKNKTPTEINVPQPQITLSLAEEPALNEIYLNLEMKNVEFPQVYSITHNGSAILTDTLITNDTTVMDTGLTPSTSYNYKAYRLVNGQKTDSSALLQAATMDTTSHEFTWEILTFGDGLSNSLLDVAIVNERDIWAVGDIQLLDSTGQWIPYNAVHFDGQQWELQQMMVKHPTWSQSHPSSLNGVFAFSGSDIWFSTGNVHHYDSTEYSNNLILTSYFLWDMGVLNQNDGEITKIWGSSPNDIYFVGKKGTIVHYDDSNWQRIESSTGLNFEDIWGAWDSQNNYWEIIAVASELFVTNDRFIYQISPVQQELSNSGINWPLSTLWFSSNKHYYVAGSHIYEKNRLSENMWQNKLNNIVTNYTFRIRANDINDVIATGGFGDVLHFNGMSWKSFFSETQINGNYYSIDIKDELVVAVGYHSSKAVVLIGRRN